MSRVIRILHRTDYTYDRPVSLEPHHLMLRPRDGHDLWVDDAFLTIRPTATMRWFFDTFGNSVAEASFHTPTDRLSIVSELLLRRYVSGRYTEPAGARTVPFPIVYSTDDTRDLFPYLGLENLADADILGPWLDVHFTDRGTDAFHFLHALSDAIHRSISYVAREEMGTQSAAQTIRTGSGTCRDFAFLFMEAARTFGFAARFVTGYLNDRLSDGVGPVGGGATHAWADVFVPGEGWIEFDPTNRITAGGALIRVATTRKPSQASPISGSFKGPDGVAVTLAVSVEVAEVDAPG